ncbi:MAG: hypothetical protein AAF544_11855 [Bacteroidota bacterium]
MSIMRAVCILVVIFSACARQESGPPPPFLSEQEAAVAASLEGPQAYWEDWFTQADSADLNQYLSSAIRIDEAGQVDSIGQQPDLMLEKSSQTLLKLQAVGRDSQHVYTLHRINRDEQLDLAELAIWNRSSDGPMRELVFIAPYQEHISDSGAIASARDRWIQYCNAHEVDRLINEVYTPNSLYYNHKPLVRGRRALIDEYAYMANPEYHLWLDPLHLEAVSDDIYIELGQCYGSYGGQYIIVWQRQDSGDWMVLFDSNK